MEVNKYFEQECKMITNDRHEKERADARNALEEFVYDMRGRIQESGELYPYVSDTIRDKLLLELDQVENWLYEEGEDCERHVYKDRLAMLKKETDPIKLRHEEFHTQPHIFEKLGHSIQMAQKLIDEYRTGDEKYVHLESLEIQNICDATSKASIFLSDAQAKLNKLQRFEDPIIKVSDISHEIETLAACVKSVLDRPKPKPQSPPPAENDERDSQPNGDNNKSTHKGKSAEDKMDVN